MIKINGQTVFDASSLNDSKPVPSLTNAECQLAMDTTVGGLFGFGSEPAASASSIKKYVNCINGSNREEAFEDFRSVVNDKIQTFHKELGTKLGRQDFQTEMQKLSEKVDTKHDEQDFEETMQELDENLESSLHSCRETLGTKVGKQAFEDGLEELDEKLESSLRSFRETLDTKVGKQDFEDGLKDLDEKRNIMDADLRDELTLMFNSFHTPSEGVNSTAEPLGAEHLVESGATAGDITLDSPAEASPTFQPVPMEVTDEQSTCNTKDSFEENECRCYNSLPEPYVTVCPIEKDCRVMSMGNWVFERPDPIGEIKISKSEFEMVKMLEDGGCPNAFNAISNEFILHAKLENNDNVCQYKFEIDKRADCERGKRDDDENA